MQRRFRSVRGIRLLRISGFRHRSGLLRFLVGTDVGGEPVIVSARFDGPGPGDPIDVSNISHVGGTRVMVKLSDGSSVQAFSFYPDELQFSTEELVGLKVAQAHDLHRRRDIAFLRSP